MIRFAFVSLEDIFDQAVLSFGRGIIVYLMLAVVSMLILLAILLLLRKFYLKEKPRDNSLHLD